MTVRIHHDKSIPGVLLTLQNIVGESATTCMQTCYKAVEKIGQICQLARQMDNVLCQASARHHLRLLLTRRIPSVVIPITMFAEQTVGFAW